MPKCGTFGPNSPAVGSPRSLLTFGYTTATMVLNLFQGFVTTDKGFALGLYMLFGIDTNYVFLKVTDLGDTAEVIFC